MICYLITAGVVALGLLATWTSGRDVGYRNAMRNADLPADVVRAEHHPRHAPAAAGPAAVRALPLLGHRAVPAVWPQHAG